MMIFCLSLGPKYYELEGSFVLKLITNDNLVNEMDPL